MQIGNQSNRPTPGQNTADSEHKGNVDASRAGITLRMPDEESGEAVTAHRFSISRPVFFAVALAALLITAALGAVTFGEAQGSTLPDVGQTVPPPTPRPTTAPSPFQAIIYVTPSLTNTVWGETVLVTVTTVVTPSCQFPLFDITLTQREALLVHIDPPTNVIGPPGPNPAVFRLRTARPGVTVFSAAVYGEPYCGESLGWQYVVGDTVPVIVRYGENWVALPYVERK